MRVAMENGVRRGALADNRLMGISGNNNDAVLYNTEWMDDPYMARDNAVKFTGPGDQ